MDEKAYASLLTETRDFLIIAHYNSLKICNRNSICCHSCPFYDENMANSYDTRCFSILLADYAAKLSQVTKDLEEKGE